MKRMFCFWMCFVLLLSACAGTMSASAASFDLAWGSYASANVENWVKSASSAEQAATLQAFLTAYDKQTAMGFDMGTPQGYTAGTPYTLDTYGNQLCIQWAGGDNTDNPWGQVGRTWGYMSAPFAGMVFSVKGTMVLGFPQLWGSSYTPLSDEFQVDGVTYQSLAGLTLVRQADGSISSLNYYPGVGLDATGKTVLQKAYATLAWNGQSVGYADGLAASYSGTYYQKFRQTGGIVYLFADGTDTYVISGAMVEAWLSTGAAQNPFFMTGVPISNAYIDAAGNTRQDFINASLVLSADGALSILDGSAVVTGVTGKNVLQCIVDGNRILLLLQRSNLNAMDLTISATEGAVLSKSAGSFSNGENVTLTAANGIAKIYTISAHQVIEEQLEDAAKVAQVDALLQNLPDTVWRSDYSAAYEAISAYDTLNEVQQLQSQYFAKVVQLRAQLESLANTPIRVTCVGDSITEGYASSNAELYSYPAQMQNYLGSAYYVTNAGTSGSTVFRSWDYSYYPYISSANYAKGITSDPDIVIMMLGTNDAANINWDSNVSKLLADGQAATQEEAQQLVCKMFHDDYAALIEEYQAMESKPKIFIAYPLWTDNGSNREYNNTTYIQPIIDQLAQEYGLTVENMHDYTEKTYVDKDYWADTYLHPNDQGYGDMAVHFGDMILSYTASVPEVQVTDVLLDGVSVGALDTDPDAGFDATTGTYTVVLDTAEFPQITVSCGENDSYFVTTPSRSNPVVTVTVLSQYAMFGLQYTIQYDLSNVAPDLLLGDLSGDGVLSVTDVVLLRKAILQGSTAVNVPAGDLSGDGALSVTDVVLLRKAILESAV